jgi:hypothetical protein
VVLFGAPLITQKTMRNIYVNNSIKKTIGDDDSKVILIPKGRGFRGPTVKLIDSYIVSSVVAAGEFPGTNFNLFMEKLFVPSRSWQILINACLSVDHLRTIVVPPKEKYEYQKLINKRLKRIRQHESVYGFVKGKNSFDCAKSHTDFHQGAPELLINLDISNFFNSVGWADLENALRFHGFEAQEIEEIKEQCTFSVSKDGEEVKKILLHLLSSCLLTHQEWQKPGKLYFKKLTDLIIQSLDCYCPEKNNYFEEKFSSHFFKSGGAKKQKIVNQYMVEHAPILMFQAGSAGYGSLIIRDVEELNQFVSWMLIKLLKCGEKTSLGERMLYQGGPSSPFLSNLAFKLLDYRLSGFAKKVGGHYTRYADDVCFTFGHRKTTKQINLLIHSIKKIIASGGYDVNSSKVKVVGSGKNQDIVGYSVNSGYPTVSKKYRKNIYDEVKNMNQRSGVDRVRQMEKVAGKIAYLEISMPKQAKKLKEKMKNSHPKLRTITI